MKGIPLRGIEFLAPSRAVAVGDELRAITAGALGQAGECPNAKRYQHFVQLLWAGSNGL